MMTHSGKRQRLIIALGAFVVSLIATLLAVDTPPAAPASGSGGPATPSASASGPRELNIGIAYGDRLTWVSDTELAIGLDDAVNSKARWIRVDLSWNNIQPDSAKNYEWQRFDRIAKAAQDRHLEVLATIGYTPKWARRSGCGGDPSCAPAHPEAFAAFAQKAAERYAPMGVHTWEIWNEPNLPFWAPKPDPAAYTTLLKSTAASLRAADKQAYVMLGGLAAVATAQSDGYVSQFDFLNAVCELGANKVVDAIAYHPYTYPHLPSEKTDFGTAFEGISSTHDNLVGILERYGTPNLPIWLTETGAATNGPGQASDGKTTPANATHVTEDLQAAIATDTIPASAANPHVAAVFWYSDQDSGTDKDKAHRSMFYGLRRYDGTPKPALAAFGAAVAAYRDKLAAAGSSASPGH
ncbi:cellulase family glycosylhydrolase [Kitasatospora sp. NPDC092948]|uniref:cellulase family glycosylhydrolase n=1 Tax=Kitasatospora sp. NPDC092948 TaxID=3364088 RepID=UPI0037F87DB7